MSRIFEILPAEARFVRGPLRLRIANADWARVFAPRESLKVVEIKIKQNIK